ncbi:cytochrome c oxidase assembly protein [Vibrio renipiscarius]|uniref:Cytochrome c oxidase assembly protein CtaG n=1 Tax=Vibrio renipiscarius TaxID=1461322 RepID=A0A0C2JDZ9_9VIBR|nr:cytochrome c oxidase assembly protein [Vibrio renipiscarius]KII76159.1 cytochrome C oxidase assembly protein [Vibrio renipiscarius]KII78320.1 cytochrome C oxidase assembly protein [Vibrio renipiscarius]
MDDHKRGDKSTQRKANKVLTTKLLIATLAMFGFGFALVPLYDIMCDALGINGKTNREAVAQPLALSPDTSRTVRVEFIAHPNPAMPWEFKPKVTSMDVHPGEVIQTSYYAFNRANKTVIGQAVPSVSPGMGASYFNKVECFCFNKQPLDAKSAVDMPLIFYIERDIPSSIHTLTLSYTLYDITPKDPEGTEGNHGPEDTAQISPSMTLLEDVGQKGAIQ